MKTFLFSLLNPCSHLLSNVFIKSAVSCFILDITIQTLLCYIGYDIMWPFTMWSTGRWNYDWDSDVSHKRLSIIYFYCHCTVKKPHCIYIWLQICGVLCSRLSTLHYPHNHIVRSRLFVCCRYVWLRVYLLFITPFALCTYGQITKMAAYQNKTHHSVLVVALALLK